MQSSVSDAKRSSEASSELADASTPLRRNSDVQLACFARSGNMWMMNILLRGGILALPPEAFRASVVRPADLLPYAGLYRESAQAMIERRDTGPLRVKKTHDWPRALYRKTIYVIRDGCDVVTSYYFYLKARGQLAQHVTMSEYLWKEPSLRDAYTTRVGDPEMRVRGPASPWATHLVHWQAVLRSRKVHFVRYEDLLADPLPVLRGVFRFLDVARDDDALKRVIEETTFEKIRRSETIDERKQTEPNKRFFRSGKRGNWREHLSEDDIEPFKERAGQTLIDLGYEENLRWGL